LQDRERLGAIDRIAKQGDADRYVAALFVPPSARPHLLALIAFNVELARIGELVSEPALGEIRLQWWRDALDRAARGNAARGEATRGEETGNPVADAIGTLLQAYPHLRATLECLVDARRFDVAVKIMPDWPALQAYVDDTAGAMFVAAAGLLADGVDGAETAARAGGLAYGLTGLMRALPVHAARGRLDLPADALCRHGTTPEQVLAGEMTPGLADLLAELRRQARDKLDEASRHVQDLDPMAGTAFLPLSLVEPYLSALAHERHDALHQIAAINPLYRLWRMATWRGR
jgi:15-cis-phytoene synthase